MSNDIFVAVVGMAVGGAAYVLFVAMARDIKRYAVTDCSPPIARYHEEERDMKGLPPHERCGCDRCATWRRQNWHRLGVSA
jgi:hypothetical protein